MFKDQKNIYYGEYLQLNKLLDCQHPVSKDHGNEAHDETLFIIVHQVYELWFKQIIHELKSVQDEFSKEYIKENKIHKICHRLKRIQSIQPLLLEQLDVMETMTPIDFLEFRDLLIPASGFQSVQFREIEIRLGLSTENRIGVDREFFLGRLSEEDKEKIRSLENEKPLIHQLQDWLERMPFTKFEEFDFWNEYKNSVDQMLDQDKEIILNNTFYSDKEREIQLRNLDGTRSTFYSLLDENEHSRLCSEGKRKLSQKATLNALFILLFRDQPILQAPFNLLNQLIEIDEGFTSWRYRHSLMAHRMLGTKIGTGGSSGHEYLKRATENNRVFRDLFDLSTFIIPKKFRPKLPESLKKQLNFYTE